MVDFFRELDIFSVELFESFVETGVAELVVVEVFGLLEFDLDDFLADFVGAGLADVLGDEMKCVWPGWT